MKTCHSNMLAVLAAALLALSNANAAELTVEVTGIAQPDGQVVVSLFNQSETLTVPAFAAAPLDDMPLRSQPSD